MLKLAALLSFVLLFSRPALAQYSHISGSVADTMEKRSMANASILLLRPADSILIAHTRTDASGAFRLKKIPTGHYLLLVTYPSYADYVDEIDAKDTAGVVLPTIPLVLKSKLLEAVVVQGNRAVRIKGDTTEFTADSFRTEAGASVEDLLKKLPGIQVDRNGKITAQGERVKKVLVDGEEFFGDDPTLVTQNLRADMVDKVQVYDKKSDQATFTGIDDGQREKTINLKLKNGKKNGYFGRLTAGAGTDGYYDEQLMANYFKNKEKLAAYGIISNTGKTGLNWSERDNYGQSFAGSIDVDETTGSLSWAGGNNDDLDTWSGQYEGQGYPAVKTGGAHFNNKWDDDMQSLNGNYKYMDLAVKGNSTTNTENILPDTLYFNNQQQTFNNRIIRHTIDGNYELKFDTTSSIKIMADGGTDHKTTFNQFTSDYLAADSSVVNSSNRTTSTTGDKRIVNSNFLWRKKLGRPGRTVSLNVRENYTDDASSGYLYSDTRFYQGGLISSDSLINQYKDFRTTTTLLDTKATYTEPLSRYSFLVGNYGVVVNNSHSDRNSFNESNGKYTALDSLYSNDYQYNVFMQRGGLAYTLIKKKLRFSAGTDLGFANFRQRDLVADTSTTRKFVNWYPTAAIGYAFSSMSRLGISYQGITTQPSVTQIQPILTNEDPLNVYIGNPGLKPQFANNFRLFYNSWKVLTQSGMYADLSAAFTPDFISTSSTVDATGKRTNQYVNVNGTYNYNGSGNYSWFWKKLNLHPWFGVTASGSNTVNIVNGVPNTTTSGTYGFGPGFWTSKEKKFDFNMDVSFAYTTSRSSINSGVTTHYWTYTFQPNGNLYLPLKFQLHADAEINLRQKTSVFDNNNNVVKIDVWFGKKFLKHDNLLVKVAVNDLLNQNIGFNRTVNSNFISQNTYSTIRRFGMLSVVWNFNKSGLPAPKNN